MHDVADAELLPLAALSVETLRTALREAMHVGDRLSRAYRVLDRVAGGARSPICPVTAPQLEHLQSAIEELTTRMRAQRLWTLEVAHFLESWHPFGPAAPTATMPAAAAEGGRHG